MTLTATEPCVLDPSVMAAIRSLGEPGEPDVFAEITGLFLADAPIHLLALGAAIAAQNVEAVYQTAHRLRGSSLEMGATCMAPICASLEQAARAGSLQHADADYQRLTRAFEATSRALALAIA